jgi:hypothetical protein
MPVRSILKTLDAVGFNLKMAYNMGSKDADGDPNGDVHVIAYLGDQHFDHMDFERLNPCCKILAYDFSELFLEVPITYTDGYILDDNVPNFDRLNLAMSELWRTRKQKDYDLFSSLGYSLFQ